MSQEVTKRLTSGLKPTIYSIYIGVITHLEAFYQFPGISKEREFCENKANTTQKVKIPVPVIHHQDHPSMFLRKTPHRISDSWGSEMVSTFIENHRGFLKFRKVSIPPWAERSSEICVPLRMVSIAQFHDDSSRQNVSRWLAELLCSGGMWIEKSTRFLRRAEDVRIDVWSCLVLP